jgi:hypothetical protein
MWWWLALARKQMWRWIASFGESYNGDVLQYAKQLFSLRLPQMTKYCVMRECDNIHPWICTTGDLAFSHQQEFTVLNSQKGFRRSLPEILLFSQLFDPNLKTRLPTHWYPFPLHSQGLMPCKQQSNILTPSGKCFLKPCGIFICMISLSSNSPCKTTPLSSTTCASMLAIIMSIITILIVAEFVTDELIVVPS